MNDVLPWLVAFFGGGGVVAVIVFLNYEHAEKWVSLVWRVIHAIFRRGKKAYVTHDLQGRVNSFAVTLNREAPHCQATGVRIQWVEEDEEVRNFFRDGRLVVRMRRDDDQNRNFVNASMLFVSKALVPKVKRYLSPTQKRSIDLFVGMKLFESEKPEVVDLFYEEHFVRDTEGNERVRVLLDDFSSIDKVGLFYCVLLPELAFLGEKVFFGPKSDQVIVDVNNLIEFLRKVSDREVGTEETPLEHVGAYCRSGIVIVARGFKRELGDIRPYVNWIGRLLDAKIEQVYLVGSASHDNAAFMDAIAQDAIARHRVQQLDRRTIKAAIRMPGGDRQDVRNLLIHLRSPDVTRHYDREYQAKFLEEETRLHAPSVTEPDHGHD
jgi:hypothetical protein